ncbi:MAG: Hint domain-containing protein, partial [Albidovulum sp.]|uniref:Hint domain-containing protein n=1 Tax=Albidovulum sp. TaxID=1872424 RepID=UPI003CA344FB
MPTTYKDQFYSLNPSNPPLFGSSVTFTRLTLTDQNDDDDFDRFDGDSIGGVDIVRSYPGDTVTINVPGVGNVTYTGVTFYMQGGGRYFTPTDGQVLMDGTFVSSTWAQGQGALLVSELGPACFTRGTLIRVPGGAVAVETLKAGDLVDTLDHGPQVLRWVGQQDVIGRGDLAPVVIAAGVLGNERELRVSPEHRMLMTGWLAELHFGEDEVLVAAKHLIGMPGITRQEQAETAYLHLLFDRHEIVFAEGAPSESLHPSSWMIAQDSALRAEIIAVFPELLDRLSGPPVPAAR